MPNALCEQCSSSGLPILPVRYTVVPTPVTPALPAWAGGDRVKNVSLGGEFHYALRTLREGYVYLYYEKNAFGSKQWECYTVGLDGSLHRQPSPQMARPQNGPVFTCSRIGHTNANVQFIVIEKPEKCGTTWIAFSAHKWSDETLKEYTDNTKLRNARMQTLHPAAMAGGAKHAHGALAEAAALEGVIEYAPNFSEGSLPFDTSVQPFSKEDGSYDAARLARISTRFPWALRTGEALSIAERMKMRGKVNSTKNNAAHVLALWDAIGIAHELNGYRNDAAGWIKKYETERALQIGALNAYDGLKKGLEQRAADLSSEYVRRGVDDGPLQEREKELEEKLKTSPDDEYIQAQLRDTRNLIVSLKASAPKVGDALGKSEAARARPGYQARIDPVALAAFKKNLDRFQPASAALVDKRTVPLIHWLEAPLFVDTLNDFSGKNIEDGLLFSEDIAEATFGMGSCRTGAEKIASWVRECKASVDSNLLWRVIALNQDDARAELDAALAEAQTHKSTQTLASTIAWIGYTAKTLKAFADTYKKAQSVFDANTKASSTTGSLAFGARLKPINMRGTDKFAITVGDAVFRYFRIDKLADYASEKIIQHIFSIRAFVNPTDSANLIVAQARKDGINRELTLKKLRATRAFMQIDTPEMNDKMAEELREQWRNFKAGGAPNSSAANISSATKDARLALVVGLIEGVNFAKLLADCKMKNDAKSWFSLLASGMSITSAMFDVGAVAAKNLDSMGAASWTYQKLKLWGGVLSGGASFVGGVFDLIDASKKSEEGYSVLMRLYMGKGLLGLGSGALTLAVACTYSAPFIARVTGNAGLGTVARTIGARAAAFVGLRILGMAVGGWVTLGTVSIQVLIWWATPSALEEWVDHSAFGKKRSTGGYSTGNDQDKKLEAALVEMGLQ